MLKGRRRRREEEKEGGGGGKRRRRRRREEEGGGVGVDDKRWLGVTSGFPYIEMKSLLLWSIVL